MKMRTDWSAAGSTLNRLAAGAAALALLGLPAACAVAQDYRAETGGVPPARPSSGDREPSYRTLPTSNDDDPYGYTSVPAYQQREERAPRYDRSTRLVSGRITGSTGAFGRTLKVLLDDGEERTVLAPRNVAVRRYNRPISVHELRRDESVRIRIDRYTVEGDLVGLRIDAFEGASRLDRTESSREATIRGTVSSIDSAGNILRIDVDGHRVIVRVNRAEIRASKGRIVLRDLENGDVVIVEGRKDHDEVYARIVTVR